MWPFLTFGPFANQPQQPQVPDPDYTPVYDAAPPDGYYGIPPWMLPPATTPPTEAPYEPAPGAPDPNYGDDTDDEDDYPW